MPFFICSYF